MSLNTFSDFTLVKSLNDIIAVDAEHDDERSGSGEHTTTRPVKEMTEGILVSSFKEYITRQGFCDQTQFAFNV